MICFHNNKKIAQPKLTEKFSNYLEVIDYSKEEFRGIIMLGGIGLVVSWVVSNKTNPYISNTNHLWRHEMRRREMCLVKNLYNLISLRHKEASKSKRMAASIKLVCLKPRWKNHNSNPAFLIFSRMNKIQLQIIRMALWKWIQLVRAILPRDRAIRVLQ